MNVYDVLRRDEGLRLKPYRCTAGKLSIGYGRNLDDVGITIEEAEVMLRQDVRKAERQARSEFPWFDNLSDARQAVVISMIFNLGLAGFKTFRRTISDIAAGRYAAAADRMKESKWASQVGQRAVRLSNAMRTGVLE